MRARPRRSSALDRREQGRPRGVRCTSTSIQHGPPPTDRIEANFPFSLDTPSGTHHGWPGEPAVLEFGHGRFGAVHGGHLGHQAHQSPYFREPGGSGDGPRWGRPRTRPPGQRNGRPSILRRGHLWFGDIEIILVVVIRRIRRIRRTRHIRCVRRWARPCPGRRMAAPGRGALVLMCRCGDGLDRDQLTLGLGLRVHQNLGVLRGAPSVPDPKSNQDRHERSQNEGSDCSPQSDQTKL